MFSPAMIPTVKAPRISARNGLSLTTVIRTTITAIAASAAVTQLPARCHRFDEVLCGDTSCAFTVSLL